VYRQHTLRPHTSHGPPLEIEGQGRNEGRLYGCLPCRRAEVARLSFSILRQNSDLSPVMTSAAGGRWASFSVAKIILSSTLARSHTLPSGRIVQDATKPEPVRLTCFIRECAMVVVSTRSDAVILCLGNVYLRGQRLEADGIRTLSRAGDSLLVQRSAGCTCHKNY